MPATPNAVVTLQMGTLYASGEDSSFTGTGGPWGYSPWTSQFGGVVSSAGLAAEPFDDVVYDVAAGDEVTFVIAVQNLAPGAQAFDVRVRGTMPPGFITPAGGADLSVTDGAGTDLPVVGDLFGPNGLALGAPLAGYDPVSGQNVALITYTLQAGPALAGPDATLPATALLTHVASVQGGADLGLVASAGTTVVSAAPTPQVAPETNPAAVARGQTIAFDIALPLPGGTLRDLRLDTVLPAGAAQLALVSADIVSIGAGLQVGTQVIGADGGMRFGTVVNTASTAADGTIVARLVLRADGTVSGPAALRTVLTAADPNHAGERWSATVSSSVGVVVPPAGPRLEGVWTGQRATPTMIVHPFAALQLGGGDPGQQGTLAITVQDGALGRLVSFPGAAGSLDPAGRTFLMTGSMAALQDTARQMLFTPSQIGTARFDITLVAADGGVAQNHLTAISIGPSADDGHVAQHFAASTATFLTSTADGQQTLAGGETYQGPVDYLREQYIYDGAEPVVIIAQAPNVFVKNFKGDAAIALLSGQNVVDAGKGSNFLIGGTGSDVFFLDGRSDAVTWDTIVGFHPGDIVTLFGFHAATSRYWWEDRAGAQGYEGRTLRADLQGDGRAGASITFAGTTKALTDSYALTTGQIGGIDYMTVFAL